MFMAARKNPHLNGYSSNQVKNLNLRSEKVWKYIDWVFSVSCDKESIKKDVALALLNKLVPSKIEGNVKLEGEMAYAQRVFQRLGIPYDLTDAQAN